MSKDIKFSYKRKLYAVLAGIIFLLGLSIMLEKTDLEALEAEKNEGVSERVSQTYTYVEQYREPVCYVYDDTMYKDESYIYQEGEEGSKSVTVLSVYREGKLEEERVLDAEILEPAEPEIVHVGTKDRPEYIIPVREYVISSGFGPRWGTSHKGVDFAVETGTPVMASKDGIVTQTGWNGGYGISVYVDHGDGEETRYAHLSEAVVEVGDQVSQGDVIAYSGNTGRSTGPHLHFEIRFEGEPVDPMDYAKEE